MTILIKKKRILKSCFILLHSLFATICLVVYANSQNAYADKEKQNFVMRFSKEVLSFDVYWMGIYVGKASLVAKNESDSIIIISKIDSAPIISNIYKVDDFAQSTIVKGRPVNFKIKQHEGRYRSNKETIFDSGNNKVIYLNHLKGERYEHPMPDNQELWDVISGFYYLRTFPLEVGKSIFINLFDSNKFYSTEVKVIGKEKLRIFDNWISETFLIKPVLLSEGLFRRKGDIKIWLTDDESKIPVKVETSISIGKITAKIRSIETIR